MRLTLLFLFAFSFAFSQTRIYNHNIESKGWIQYKDTLKADFSIQDYYFIARDGFRFSLESQNSNTAFRYDLFTKDGDGTDNVVFNIFAKGTVADASNAEKIRLWYNAALAEYCLTADTNGTGLYRPILIAADGSPDQLKLLTNGNVSIKNTITDATWGGDDLTASQISDFDTEVSNNTSVTANTAKVSADGSVTTHSDVTSAGSGAIITSGERTAITHSNRATLDLITSAYTDADSTKLDGIATNANNYVHPNHTGDVTSTGDGATIISVDAVDIPMLSATGTADGTTFLRGDNTWATPSGAGGGVEEVYLWSEMASTMSSTGRSFLGATGSHFLSYSGTGASNEESGWVFIVPSNYTSGGRIDLFGVTAGTTDSLGFEIAITITTVGEDRATVSENISFKNTVGSPASWDLWEIQDYPITATIEAGDKIALKINRPAQNAGDTYTGIGYLEFVVFEFNY